jgi:ribose transport system ATP-binding protein
VNEPLNGSRTSARTALLMEGIRKTFPGVIALDGVHLDVRKGEAHVLLGENGAGKSTLMKILGGALTRDAGDIIIEGEPVAITDPRHAQALGIGVIYQELHLIPHLTVGENILLGREPMGVGGLIDQQRLHREAQIVLDDLRAGIDSRTPVNSLSIAQQQVVEIARAMSLRARILVMDEPTSALTESEIRTLFDTIRRLKESGVAIIYISHRLEEIFVIGDRVTVLLDGKNVGTFDLDTVTRPELVRLMANREIKEHFPRVRTEHGEEILRVEHLSRPGILNDISLTLHRGEILGIAGLMGSGRTELARAIFGLDRPTSGKVSVKGAPSRRMTPARAIRRGIGFLTEDRKSQGLILKLSVKENIVLASLDRMSAFGVVRTREEDSAATRFVDELRIRTPSIGQRVMALSGGNQQKVLLSRWLCSQAEIFIFDEPTRGIDVGAKVEIYRLMNRLTEQGAGVLMISSDLPEILGMSDRILVMRSGAVVAELDAADATQEAVLRHALLQQESSV